MTSINQTEQGVTLKPCPFCGSEAEIERLGDSRRSTIYQCTSCGCSLETGEEWGHGGDWNKRAMLSASPTTEQGDLVERLRDLKGELPIQWTDCRETLDEAIAALTSGAVHDELSRS